MKGKDYLKQDYVLVTGAMGVIGIILIVGNAIGFWSFTKNQWGISGDHIAWGLVIIPGLYLLFRSIIEV